MPSVWEAQRTRRRWALFVLVAAPVLYWIHQCALPWHPLVAEAFAVEGSTSDFPSVRVDGVAAKHLPLGMPEDDAIALLRKAGFRITPALREPRVPPRCPACDREIVARFDESVLCGGEAVSIALGFADGRLAYRSAARVLREFYI